MSIIGNPLDFAIEVVLHPDSPKTLAQCFGMFRFWVAGQAYGRTQPDATCLAGSYDSLKQRLGQRGTHPAQWLTQSPPIEVLRSCYWLIYTVTDDEVGSGRVSGMQIQQAQRMIMAPDGDEAFDDGSFIVQWDEGDAVVVVAGIIAEGDVTSKAPIVDPIRCVRCSAGAFYDVLANAVHFFESLDTESRRSDHQ